LWFRASWLARVGIDIPVRDSRSFLSKQFWSFNGDVWSN
jgi:hypothetical protein